MDHNNKYTIDLISKVENFILCKRLQSITFQYPIQILLMCLMFNEEPSTEQCGTPH